MKKEFWLFLLLALTAIPLFAGCGSGGGNVSSNNVASGIKKISGPTIIPPAVLSGEQTTVSISAYIPDASHVELYTLEGVSYTKIGDMLDDGKNGDKLGGDQVYTIQSVINESVAMEKSFRFSAVINGNQDTRDIKIPVVHIETFPSEAAFNKAADALYTKALQTQQLFGSPGGGTQETHQVLGDNLLVMFSKFEAITKQDVGFEIWDMALNTNSCNQILAAIEENPNDTRFDGFKRAVAESSKGLITEDMLSDPDSNWRKVAVEQTRKFLVNGKVNTDVGCNGGYTEQGANIIVKEETGQFFSLAKDAISELSGFGKILVKSLDVIEDINKAKTIVGWLRDDSGKMKTVIAKSGNSQPFEAPSGTYNLFNSLGGDTPRSIVKNIAVIPQQTTTVSLTPGTIVGGYSASGDITLAGKGLADVNIKLTGFEVSSKTTDVNGHYSFLNLANGQYTVTPSKVGYSFTPSSLNVTVNNGNVSVQDIVATVSSNPDVTVPLAPSNLSATAFSASHIDLTWQDNSNNETGFKIERKTGTNGIFSQIATVGAIAGSGSGGSYENAYLAANTDYCYRVRAYNSTGDSTYSPVVCDTTYGTMLQPTVSTGSASNISSNSATLNGTANPNGIPTGGFFQYGTTTVYGATTTSQIWGNGSGNVSVSANLTGLTANTTYHYRLVATTDNAGGTVFGADQIFRTAGGKIVTVSNTNGIGLRLRNGAGLSYSSVASLYDGTQMTVIGGPIQADGYTWWNLTGSQGTGWSAVGDWLTPEPSMNSSVTVSNTGGGGLRLHSCALLSCSTITTLPEGTQMTVFSGPQVADGYSWWAIQGNVGGVLRTGWSAVGNWLAPNPRY